MRPRRVRTALIVMCLSTTATAVAGTYKLTTGAGEAVCDAYARNLEPRHDEQPMACEREYNRAIKGFSSPSWRKLDLAEHFELYRAAWIYAQQNDNSAQGIKMSPEEIERFANEDLTVFADAHHVELHITTLALLGNGQKFNVLLVSREPCGPYGSPTMRTDWPVVLDKTKQHVNTEVPESWNAFPNSTIEMFRGVPYLESYYPDHGWQSILTDSGVLTVWRWESSGLRSVCEISWSPQEPSAVRSKEAQR